MNDALCVHLFQTLEDLQEDHQAGLCCELSTAEIKQVFQRWAQQFLNHEYVVIFHQNALVM